MKNLFQNTFYKLDSTKNLMSYVYWTITGEIDELRRLNSIESFEYTFFYKNHVYKNVEAQIFLKFKNIVVILLVSLSLSQPQMRFRRSYKQKKV